MDCSNENESVSHMRPLSRIPSPGKLKELPASNFNSRSSSMPPPPIQIPSRKTLAERAGEPNKPAPLPSGSRSINVNNNAFGTAGPYRDISLTASTSSNRSSSSISTRNPSFSSSTSSSIRPYSTYSHRPQSAAGNSRIRKPSTSQHRSSTSLGNRRLANSVIQGTDQNTGMAPFPSVSPEIFQCGNQKSDGSFQTQMKKSSGWVSFPRRAKAIRDISLNTMFSRLTLHNDSQPSAKAGSESLLTPSRIPKQTPRTPAAVFPAECPSPSKSQKKQKTLAPFLTRDSNLRATDPEWDSKVRIENVEKICFQLQGQIGDATSESVNLKKLNSDMGSRIHDLEAASTRLAASNASLQSDLDETKSQLKLSKIAQEDSKRLHSIQIDDLQRQHRHEIDDIRRGSEENSHRLVRAHDDELDELKKRLEKALEDEALRRQADFQALANEKTLSQNKVEAELNEQREIVRRLEDNLQTARADITRERGISNDLKARLSDAASQSISLETSMRSLRAQIDFLESDNKSQSHAFVDLETRLQNAIRCTAETNEKLRKEETLRRKLHNQVQELKGNIRVFCRVRPSLPSEPKEDTARITYPDTGADSKEVEIFGQEEKSSLGNITTKKNSFTFDRVFTPDSVNADVFEEISQLVQSALDGYNVCIFCYGQTGSGKTHTMSADDGMIPRAVHQIYDTAKSLEEKGWRYSMEGSFVEVYNENLNDLLGKPDELDKKKHEIRHDMQKCKTTITDITTVDLDTPDTVESILRRATANRSVAATKANERSSRSHSVFILKLIGENSTTGERSEGTLNLVDLAGSERLGHSKATGERLKETQNINKSLSCLGDVIGALGQGKEGGHIPYRNSKLTYLLQFSLGGNSKTLMFVMISPLQAHLNESLTSLKFATKVHNTHIGTAKRQAKVREL